MSEFLNTRKRDYKFNGPVNSADYNDRIEENYKDLVYLYNKASVLDSKLADAFEKVLKDQAFLSAAVLDMEDRVRALESANNKVSIHSFNQLDYGNFVNTIFAISSTQLLHFDPIYNVITLPIISSGSYSKLKFGNQSSGQIIPKFFKAKIDNNYTGADSPGTTINSTPIYNCILDDPNKVWKRNIVADSSVTTGSQMMAYFKVPTESTGSYKANELKLNPYPAYGVDIVSIEYTTKPNPSLDDSDGWTPLNDTRMYNNVSEAIGKVPPGGWDSIGSDKISNSGPLAFHFAEIDASAIRVKFAQRNYFREMGNNVYTYGLSDLDVRYNKYMPEGKTIIKFTPSDGQTISNITNITPKIFNVPLNLISSCFSYRVIYQDGGSYSLSNPGASNSVWIEVTLTQLDDKTPPVLSDLIVEYT
jgi:hypothetical protein